jgi:hypothetical protein
VCGGLTATALAGAKWTDQGAPEPYKDEDLAYLNKPLNIPWASRELMEKYQKFIKEAGYGKKAKETALREGRGDWGFWADETASNHLTPEEFVQATNGVVSVCRQLKALGIEFIYMPIPDASMIYPDEMMEGVPLDANGLPPQITLGNKLFFDLLDKEGVTYVNLSPAYIAARKFSRHGHCRINASPRIEPKGRDVTHWTPYGVAVATHVLANQVRRQAWLKAYPKLTGLTAQWQRLAVFSGTHDDPRWPLYQRVIGGIPAGKEKSNDDAPILVVGDSNLEKQRGVAQNLMYELKVPVASIGGMWRGPAQIIEKASSDPDWLLKKKLIVWAPANRGLSYKNGLEHRSYVIFPQGAAAAKERAQALAGASGQLSIVATLEANSTGRTAQQWVPYTSALLYMRFKVDALRGAGKYPFNTIMAAGWGLVDKKQTWLTQCKSGQKFRLELEAMRDHPELKEMGGDQDAYEDLTLPPYLIVGISSADGQKIEPLPGGPKDLAPASKGKKRK